MKRKLLVSVGSIIAACFLVAGGVSHYDDNTLINKDNATFYSGLNRYNVFKIWKSSKKAAQAEDLYWKEDNVLFSDGNMLLKIDKDDAGRTGGEVYTFRKFGFGLYKVRMKPIKNSGVVSSFFNYAQDEENGTEIDIEFLGYDTTKVQFNYYTNGVGKHEYLYDLGFDASEEFHEYAFRWTKDSIKWYVDDQLAYEANTDIPQMEAYIFMDAWPGNSPEWLGEYDGKTPLYAYYDWFSYTAEK